MKGITPVIAIILLLLMAVAAAGGFYFVYQSFSEEGEASGSEQIESLGEQTLAQIKIESVSSGKLYVRNRGASDLDLSQVTVYVENVPYEVNVSTETLGERERAVIKFTEVPSCPEERCEIRVSGPATAAENVERSRLSCSSDNDCAYAEVCSGGICIEENVDCGDGVCSGAEKGYGCWEDCYWDPWLFLVKNFTNNNDHLSLFNWNGTSYELSENVTSSAETSWWMPIPTFRSDGTAAAFSEFGFGGSANKDIYVSTYDGSSWSYPQNITEDPSGKSLFFHSIDSNSTGDSIFVWRGMLANQDRIYWSSIVDGTTTDNYGMADTNAPAQAQAFAFSGDTGHLIFANETTSLPNGVYNVMTREWTGSGWGAYENIASISNEEPSLFGIDFSSNGDGMAIWRTMNNTNHFFAKYATYDGSAWTYRGNVDPWEPTNETAPGVLSLAYDHEDNPLVAITTSAGGPPDGQTFTRYVNGAWQPFFNFTGDPLTQTILFPLADGTIFVGSVEASVFAQGEWQYSYSIWNGDGWAIERRWMETYP